MKILVYKAVCFEVEVNLQEQSANIVGCQILASQPDFPTGEDIQLGDFTMSDVALGSVGKDALRIAKEFQPDESKAAEAVIQAQSEGDQ